MEIDRAIGPGTQTLWATAALQHAILDAIFYVVRGGIAWRLRPHDLPPWRIVYFYFMVWRREGLWQHMHDTLRDQVRLRSGKKSPDRCDPRFSER